MFINNTTNFLVFYTGSPQKIIALYFFKQGNFKNKCYGNKIGILKYICYKRLTTKILLALLATNRKRMFIKSVNYFLLIKIKKMGAVYIFSKPNYRFSHMYLKLKKRDRVKSNKINLLKYIKNTTLLKYFNQVSTICILG